MIYTEKVKIGLRNVGKDNTLKNNSILEILENVGAYHSDSVGYGLKNLQKKGIGWILLDWKLRVIERPKYGQELTVNTWSRGLTKAFTYREYEIFDDNNKLCAIATSKWTLINIKERKIEKITEEMINKYDPEEKIVFSEAKLDKLRPPTEFISKMDYIVKRRDIDVNKHMHNLYYLDLAYDAMPEEAYNKRPFNNIRISYKKEIMLRR